MKKRIFALAVMVASVITLAACGQQEEVPAEPMETAVAVEEVYEGSLTGTNRFIGQVQAGGNAVIMPKIPGEIIEISVGKGDSVEKGQVIAKINNQDLQAQVNASKAQLEQARNNLKRAENGRKQAGENVSQAENALAQAERGLEMARSAQPSQEKALKEQQTEAEKQLADAREQLAHLTQLAEEGGATEEQVAEAEQLVENILNTMMAAQNSANAAMQAPDISALESAVRQAESGVEMAKGAKTDAELAINDAQTAVNQAESALKAAEDRLNDAIIRTTADGEITALDIKVGDFVSQQTPVAQIMSLDSVLVTVHVTGSKLPFFSVGDLLTVEVAGIEGEHEGEVTYIASSVNETGLFAVEVEIASPDANIRQGMMASLYVDEVLVEEELIVPTESIIEKQRFHVCICL